MKYVDLSPVIDPQPYLAIVESLEGQLPAGAFRFASDPDHYDFYGQRCVKDLMLERLEVLPGARTLGAVARYRPNEFKHVDALVISYTNVMSINLSVHDKAPLSKERLDGVILDEIMPHPLGVVHEVAFHRGSLEIICAELEAEWGRRHRRRLATVGVHRINVATSTG